MASKRSTYSNKARNDRSGDETSRKKSQPKRSSQRPAGHRPHQKAMSGEKHFLYGVHTIRAALQNNDRKLQILHATENGLTRLGEELVSARNLSIQNCDGAQLDRMVGPDAVHQGVILECEPLLTLDASELFHLADARLLLALDQITDPHNVGAILRSAVAMGVEAVLMTSRNSALETGVLAKSASGALDMVKLVHLRNLSKSLQELNKMGFATIGLDSEGPLVLEDTLDEQSPRPVCLVLGSEGKGLREQTRLTCTALARLDMPGPIKSLNVSNAAALSLYITAKAVTQ